LRAEPRCRERARCAGAHERLVLVSLLEQRDEEARGERVAGCGAVDRVDPGRGRARDLLPVVQQHGAFRPQRDRDEAVATAQELELEPVDDSEVGIDLDRTRGRGVEAKHAGRSLPRREHRRVRDLELAEDGVVPR
jgi:hypothetical protein